VKCPKRHIIWVGSNYFKGLWHLIRNWLSISISSVDSFRAKYHFVQFEKLGGFSRSTHHFLKLIDFSFVRTIWKEMNNRIFNNKVFDLNQMLDKIKLSFMWLKANMISFALQHKKR